MWLFYALLAGALYTGEVLLIRHFLRAQKDAWAFSFFYSLVGSLVSLPFMLSAPVIPRSFVVWLLAVLAGLLIVGHNLLVFKASGEIEASLIGAISKLRLAWVFLLGFILLHNDFSWTKLLGTFFAIVAGAIIFNKFKRPRSASAIAFAVVATFLNASIIILSKYLLGSFNAASLTFFATFLPAAILNLIFMPDSVVRIRKMAQLDWRIVSLACGLGALANLALNQGLALRDASSVLVISEVFLVVVLAGEHLILKEKEYLWLKVASISLAIIGAVLIQVSY